MRLLGHDRTPNKNSGPSALYLNSLEFFDLISISFTTLLSLSDENIFVLFYDSINN